jgi:hypothetical protein
MLDQYTRWFHNTQDVLFGLEFLIVQVFLIVHLVRALFFRGKRSPSGPKTRTPSDRGGPTGS